MDLPVYNATSCPENVTDLDKRSKEINCTKENPYMCLPNRDLTEILEICHHEPQKGLSPGEKTDTIKPLNLHIVHIFHACLIFILFYLFQMQVYVFFWIHGTTLALVCTDADIFQKAVQLHGMNHMHVSFKIDLKINSAIYVTFASDIGPTSCVVNLYLF